MDDALRQLIVGTLAGRVGDFAAILHADRLGRWIPIDVAEALEIHAFHVDRAILREAFSRAGWSRSRYASVDAVLDGIAAERGYPTSTVPFPPRAITERQAWNQEFPDRRTDLLPALLLASSDDNPVDGEVRLRFGQLVTAYTNSVQDVLDAHPAGSSPDPVLLLGFCLAVIDLRNDSEGVGALLHSAPRYPYKDFRDPAIFNRLFGELDLLAGALGAIGVLESVGSELDLTTARELAIQRFDTAYDAEMEELVTARTGDQELVQALMYRADDEGFLLQRRLPPTQEERELLARIDGYVAVVAPPVDGGFPPGRSDARSALQAVFGIQAQATALYAEALPLKPRTHGPWQDSQFPYAFRKMVGSARQSPHVASWDIASVTRDHGPALDRALLDVTRELQDSRNQTAAESLLNRRSYAVLRTYVSRQWRERPDVQARMFAQLDALDAEARATRAGTRTDPAPGPVRRAPDALIPPPAWTPGDTRDLDAARKTFRRTLERNAFDLVTVALGAAPDGTFVPAGSNVELRAALTLLAGTRRSAHRTVAAARAAELSQALEGVSASRAFPPPGRQLPPANLPDVRAWTRQSPFCAKSLGA